MSDNKQPERIISDDLKNEAIRIWLNYGEVVKQRFSLEGFFETNPLTDKIKTQNEADLKRFIEHIKEETKKIENIF